MAVLAGQRPWLAVLRGDSRLDLRKARRGAIAAAAQLPHALRSLATIPRAQYPAAMAMHAHQSCDDGNDCKPHASHGSAPCSSATHKAADRCRSLSSHTAARWRASPAWRGAW